MCDVSNINNEANHHSSNNNNTTSNKNQNNNNNNNNNNKSNSKSTDNGHHSEPLSAKVLDVFRKLARERSILNYDIEKRPVSGVGDNSYGLVLQVRLIPTQTLPTATGAPVLPFSTILKIAPKNAARRALMKVADYYSREVFMYELVLSEYRKLQLELPEAAQQQLDIAPRMLYSNLVEEDEFIIFDDLTQQQFTQNSRTKMPDYDLVMAALQALARLHALSFVLQARKPQVFQTLVSQMHDNLFTPQIDTVSVEFGKKYVRRTRLMLEEELELQQKREKERSAKLSNPPTLQHDRLSVDVLQRVEDNFKDICLRCVDGKASAPYAVICHGDFWNNNILYKYDATTNSATEAKLIDFQMSRYSSPVLDLIHYLFACTEKDLRDAHFHQFLQIYYDALAQCLRTFGLTPDRVYPEAVFAQHLSEYGVYGFCMSAFAIPFFISNTSELPDFDEVSEAIRELSSASSASSSSSAATSSTENSDSEDNNNTQSVTKECDQSAKETEEHKCREVLEEYEFLTKRTEPIFKRRMLGIAADLIKYDMTKIPMTI